MPTISIVAFRGLGALWSEESAHHAERALVRAGHVAVEGIEANQIIGFSPTPEIVKELGGEDAVLERLRYGDALPGRLQDDALIFHRAKALAEAGERTKVWELEVEISEHDLEIIRQWYNEETEALYNFPSEDGSFVADEYNCATFLALLNVDIPTHNGKLKVFISAMIQKGAKPWRT